MVKRLAIVAVIVVGAALVAWLLWGRSGGRPSADAVGSLERASNEVLDRLNGTPPDGRPALSAEAPSQVPEDAETTMTLVGGEVTISYPADYGLAVNPDQLLVESSVPFCDEGFAYCIYLRSDAFAGTNFDGAALSIVLRDDLDYQADCLLSQPAGFSELEPVIDGGAGHATATYHQVGQGAAGHVTSGALYRLYYADTCYEFESRVARAQYDNFEPGSVERFDDADLQGVRAQLRSIVASVSLPDGRDTLFSRETTTGSLVEDSQVRDVEPPEGATVSSPIELSGEALGVWFFEGNFPYRLQTQTGDVLATGAVTATADWMTTEFVPFEASIEYVVPASTAAELVLMNDNPSGLPENDASLTLPLTLLP